MSLAGWQINPIDVNFHLQKSLEIFYTNSADKIQSQNYKRVKVPCLMPIRVNAYAPNKWSWLQFEDMHAIGVQYAHSLGKEDSLWL